LSRARKIICVETNETGQFADLIKLKIGVDIRDRILKYDGLPFSSEELTARLGSLLK
jgi:2-oxoglutarate ferredoxin oxidoreductase subunit alpha